MMPHAELKPISNISLHTAKPDLRNNSIDIFRAITMVLMIFVNDFRTLLNYPEWLGHMGVTVDAIGLADFIFPAFVFIMGMSLPFSIDSRRRKGYSEYGIAWHIITRSFTLILMGVFILNGETIDHASTGVAPYVWNPLARISFILLLIDYPESVNRKLVYAIKGTTISILIVLAVIYRGQLNGQTTYFSHQWWGILGQIGWSYFIGAFILLFSRNNFFIITASWLFFCSLCIGFKSGIIQDEGMMSKLSEALVGGALPAFTVCGIMTTMIYRYFRTKNSHLVFTFTLLGFSALLVVLSVLTRPYWKLSKLSGTPAWLFLCSAAAIIAFIIVYWIVDVTRKTHWFNFIQPAGNNTLLCYLLPYFVYGFLKAIGFQWPDWMISGNMGLMKSALFALFCVFIAGRLGRVGIRLKL